MNHLIDIAKPEDIPEKFINTPIARMLEYQNMGAPHGLCSAAEMLVGTCVDNRIQFHLPANFAFVIRAGGANMKYNEFKISYALSIGNLEYFALIGHTQCGMVNLIDRKEEFVNGLVKNAGWKRDSAIHHFNQYAPEFEIHNEVEFVVGEAHRLQLLYPKICIVPMLYNVDNHRLQLIG